MPALPSSSTTSSSRPGRLLAPAIALVAVAGLGVASLGGDGPAPTEDAATAPSPAPTTAGPSDDPAGGASPSAEAPSIPDLARREPGDPRAKGEVDAPVVMIEWADFQCPFCGRFARETAPTLTEKYVEDGVLRIEWRDFPYLGPESTEAALAGRAAAEQDAFWEFHDAVFADAREPNSGELEREQLLAIAESLGLDVAAFEATMDDPATAAAVQQEFQEAQALGVTGTPAFLVNGQPMIGAQPLDAFTQLIESAADDA